MPVCQGSVGGKVVKNNVKGKANAISAIRLHGAGFSDLEAIGRAVGHARIVMMGDQDH